jgi:phosphatidate cytidylyltransferase
LLGAIGFYFINRNKPTEIARQSWTKYISYFIIIHILFFSIVWKPIIFSYLTLLIIIVAAYELYHLHAKSHDKYHKTFMLAIVIWGLCSAGFYRFGLQNKSTILFAFLTLSIFDSFSQISGQLFGRRKIMPTISPNKTLGGLIGGSAIAIVSAILLRDLYPKPLPEVFFMATGIVVFAFVGDISSSWYKRKYKVKDFSHLIPGHGGFLDRFDSLIAVGAWVTLFHFFNL